MAVITALAIGALALSAGAAYASYKQGQAAASAQKKANAVSAAQSEVNRQQAIRDQVRQERVRRAQIIAASADSGTQASSGELGAVGSLGSQAGNNIGTINRTALSQNTFSLYEQQGADARSRSALYGQVSSLAGSIGGGLTKTQSFQNSWDSWFGPPSTGINAPRG